MGRAFARRARGCRGVAAGEELIVDHARPQWDWHFDASRSDDFANHSRGAAVYKSLFAAGVLIDKLLVIDAKLVKHGGLIIMRRDDVFNGLVSELVGLAESHSAAEAAASEPDAEALAVVIAAGLAVEASFGNRQTPNLSA